MVLLCNHPEKFILLFLFFLLRIVTSYLQQNLICHILQFTEFVNFRNLVFYCTKPVCRMNKFNPRIHACIVISLNITYIYRIIQCIPPVQ